MNTIKQIYLIILLLINLSVYGQWTQIGQTIGGENINDRFGYAVSMNSIGDIIAVGSPYFDSSAADIGKVTVYKNINDNWVQLGNSIFGLIQADLTGISLSLNSIGDKLAIGIPNAPGTANLGKVKVFQLLNDNWNQIGNDLEGLSSFDLFGSVVDLSESGNILAVGAYNASTSSGTQSGYVKIFSFQNNT